uniref:Solute carrier family 25 member 46 n=1 Tax=Ascaris suum TaxID=6253 RepID=F1KYZ9_ASCSU
MSSYLIRNAQQSPTHYRFGEPQMTNATTFGNMSGGPESTWNSNAFRDYPGSSISFGNSSGFPSTSASDTYDYSTTVSKPQDPVASVFIGLADVATKMLITHPCTVLRRQCQVHQFARCLHLTPLTLAPVVCNVITGEGVMTMWKGAIGCGVLWAMSAATEILIADIFGLPRTIVQYGSTEKFCRHIALKAGTYFAMTPFLVSSFIETVRSETGLGGDDIRVMDVITNGINRLRFDFFGPRDNSKRFALLHLAVPTVIYHTSHYLISNATYDWIYVMARRYVNRKPSNERTLFHQYLPQMFAAMTSQVLADLACYPFETILHRLYIQGTRTLIDNLDNGVSAISITAKYSGFFDCSRSIVNREGFWALYSGVGALAIQYLLHFSFLRLVRWMFDYGTRALASSQTLVAGASSNAPYSLADTSQSSATSQPLAMPTMQTPKPHPYPTFGQTSASAFGHSSPPLIGSPPSASVLADRPLAPLLLSSDYSTTSEEAFPRMDYTRDYM